MYESFYGLRESPFSLTPDPDFLFINQNFRTALEQINYAINRREAISVVVGDVGTGKTTLCWALLMRMGKNVRTALILNPLLNSEDMLRAIIQDFGIKARNRRAPWRTRVADGPGELRDASWLEGLTRKQLIDELTVFLLEGAEADLSNILVIDEAQNLSLEVLEQLRILSNLETSKRKLLQIILVGQLELDQKLSSPQLRPLNQRITVRCSLQPLSRDDMVRYIYHRLWVAGGNQSVSFSEGALKKIYEHSGGYPRLVNIICDRALLAGYNKHSRNISAGMAQTALAELGMGGEKIARIPSPLSFRRAVTATAGLMVFAGLGYFVRPWNFITGLADHQQTIELAPASADTANSDMPSQLPQSADRPSQPAVISSSAPSGNPAFLLQVHSLKTQRQADSALADLKRKGYPALQRFVLNPDNTRWYVVYLGPFDDLEAAREAARRLLQREQLATILRSSASPGN